MNRNPGDVFCYRRGSDVHPRQLVLQDAVRGHAFPPATATMKLTTEEGRRWYALLSQARRYLEWGAGGTTVVAAWRATHPSFPALEAHTIESDETFLSQLRSSTPQIVEAEAAGSLRIRRPNLDPLGKWAMPANWSSREPATRKRQSADYVQRLPTGGCCFDFILIDGRFRQACLLQALRLSHDHTTVILHDFYSMTGPRPHMFGAGKKHRARYNYTASRWYEHVQRVDTLTVLRPRRGAVEAAKQGSAGFEEQMRMVLEDYA